MRTIYRTLLLAATLAFASSPLFAQTTITTTTLNGAVSASATTVNLTSATNVVAPSATFPGSELFMDQEAMLVLSLNGTVATVARGYDGSKQGPHATLTTVYVAPISGNNTGSPYVFTDPPVGACTLTSEPYSLRINVRTGEIWACTASVWLNVIDSYVWVAASACTASGSTATAQTNYGVQAAVASLGPIPIGASFVPVYQYASTAGTSHNYMCQIPVPTRTSNASRGSYLVDATFFYGVQQTLLPTQAATLASGFFNGVAVFTSVTLPAAAAAETASTVTPVRADAGTLLITPVVASFNVALTTAGAFDSVKFTPATPFSLATDLTAYYLNVNFLVTTGVMTTNTPGFIVHYRMVTGL